MNPMSPLPEIIVERLAAETSTFLFMAKGGKTQDWKQDMEIALPEKGLFEIPFSELGEGWSIWPSPQALIPLISLHVWDGDLMVSGPSYSRGQSKLHTLAFVARWGWIKKMKKSLTIF